MRRQQPQFLQNLHRGHGRHFGLATLRLGNQLRELGWQLGVGIGSTASQHRALPAFGEFLFQLTHALGQLQHRFFFRPFGGGFCGEHFHLFPLPYPLEHTRLHRAHVEDHCVDTQFVAHFFQRVLG